MFSVSINKVNFNSELNHEKTCLLAVQPQKMARGLI